MDAYNIVRHFSYFVAEFDSEDTKCVYYQLDRVSKEKVLNTWKLPAEESTIENQEPRENQESEEESEEESNGQQSQDQQEQTNQQTNTTPAS